MTHVATLTIDHTKVAGDLTDYVVVITPNSDAGWAELYALATEGGGDIRVYKDDDTTELAREIVSFSVSSETGEIYIKFSGTLSSSVDTDIHIYADGTSSDYAVTATYGRNNVWTDYWGVWHMNSTTDSTGNNNLTENGGMSSGGVTGKIGSGTDFDGTDDQYTTNDIDATTLLTATVWVNPDSWNSGQTQLMQQWAPSDRSWMLQEGEGAPTGTDTKLRAFISSNGSFQGGNVLEGTTAMSTSTWYKATLTYSGANTRATIYLNGSQEDQNTSMPSSINVGTGVTRIGGYSGNVLMFNGQMDEARLSKTEKTANWESTEYANQNSPTTFYSVAAIATNTTVSPSAQALTFSLPAETVTGAAEVTVGAQLLTTSLPAETVTANWSVSPTTQIATFTLPTPTVQAQGITILPDAQQLTFSLPAEAILGSAIVSPDAQSLTFSLPAETVTADWKVSVDPVTLTVTVPTLEFVGAIWGRTPRTTTGADWTRSAINNDA